MTPEPTGTLEALPRRLALTLPELTRLAELAGGAPLPFELADGAGPSTLQDRLGESPGDSDVSAYATALASLHDPTESLERRGLVVDDTADAGVVGALGLLASPVTAVDLDLTVGQLRAKAWHRTRGNAVATLATTDGIVFELAWFPADAWSEELARVAVLPEDHELRESAVPDVDLPFELLDAGVEAVRTGRTDLLDTVVAHHAGQLRTLDGTELDAATATRIVSGLVSETSGRLRGLVADVAAGGEVVGVVSWVLLADGWRVLQPRRDGDVRRVTVRRVQPSELAAFVGSVVAEVTA